MAERKSSKPKDAKSALIEAALILAADRPWREITLADIATKAGLGLADVVALFPTKAALLAGYGAVLDAALIASARREAPEGSARDKLFDLLMRRFDLMGAHKAGLASALKDSLCDPYAVLCGAFQLRAALVTCLSLSNLNSDGLEGQLKIKGLGLIYLDALRVWLKDESEDLAKTMARLDRDLGRAEALVTRFCTSKSKPKPKPKQEAA